MAVLKDRTRLTGLLAPAAGARLRPRRLFQQKKKYNQAVYWLELAGNTKDNSNNPEYEKYLVYLDLGVCYYYLKEYQKAYDTNEKAGKIIPNDKTYLGNKQIYEKYLK